MSKMGYGAPRKGTTSPPTRTPLAEADGHTCAAATPASSAVGFGAPPAPPRCGHRTRWERMRGPLLTGGRVGVLTIALHFRDPHASGSWGFCPF